MIDTIGGLDIRFDINSFPEGSTIELQSNISIVNNTIYPNSSLLLNMLSDGLMLYFGTDKYHLTDCFKFPTTSIKSVRVLFHDEFCTIYIDNVWAYTFSFEYVGYPESSELHFYYYDGTVASTGTCQIANVIVQELCDWRDAVYIDLDTNATTVIQSIIQQRPVEIVPGHNGELKFYYEPTSRNNVSISYVKEHKITEEDSKSACSDAIVYASDVIVLSDPETVEEIGFITRIYRLSELDHGAVKATRMIQKKARQNMKRHRIQGRLNLAIEVGDIAVVQYITVDTQETISETFIVETIQLNQVNGETYMVIEGRNNE